MKTLARQRITVLGASGFIGGAIASDLQRHGAEVVAAARSGTVRFDLRDPNSIARAAEGSVAAVVAAGSSAYEPYGPDEYAWLHVAGIENAIAGLRHAGVEHIVVIANGDAHLHDGERMNWDENRQVPATARSSARSKALRLGEELALTASTPTAPITVLQPVHVWGPGDRKRIQALLTECASALVLPKRPTLFASTYIDHVTHAVRQALLRREAAGRMYPIADATLHTSTEFFLGLARAIGLTPRTQTPGWWKSLRMSEADRDELWRRSFSSAANIQSAVRALDYSPAISLDEGMAAVTEWHRNTR